MYLNNMISFCSGCVKIAVTPSWHLAGILRMAAYRFDGDDSPWTKGIRTSQLVKPL